MGLIFGVIQILAVLGAVFLGISFMGALMLGPSEATSDAALAGVSLLASAGILAVILYFSICVIEQFHKKLVEKE